MDLPAEELKEYRNALKDSVCSLCRKTGYEGSCRIGENGLCPVDHHLTRLVQAVLSTRRSRDLKDYVPNLRKIVCAHCENQDTEGVCQSRNLASCGLDSFLLLVVETIEEVHDRLHPAARA